MLFRTPAKQLMRPLAIFACFVVCACMPTEAAILRQLTLGEMAGKTTSIVRARVTGFRGVLRGTDVYTLYQFETLETVKGQNGAASSEVAVPGGVAGGIRQVVAGAPALRAGQEYVLFLWTGRSGLTQLMGMSQGLFAIERTAPGGVLATRVAVGEQMLDGAGHAVREQAVSMPWSELKATVKKALGTSSSAGGR